MKNALINSLVDWVDSAKETTSELEDSQQKLPILKSKEKKKIKMQEKQNIQELLNNNISIICA